MPIEQYNDGHINKKNSSKLFPFKNDDINKKYDLNKAINITKKNTSKIMPKIDRFQ